MVEWLCCIAGIFQSCGRRRQPPSDKSDEEPYQYVRVTQNNNCCNTKKLMIITNECAVDGSDVMLERLKAYHKSGTINDVELLELQLLAHITSEREKRQAAYQASKH